jgi:phosphoribosylanthranilate isomerase
MTLVKICGNRTPEDVLAAAEAGADFVGLIFAESRRRVDAAEGEAMVRALGSPLAERSVVLPPAPEPSEREQIGPWFQHGADVIEAYLRAKRPLTVGVFADQPIDEVNALAEAAGVDLVQLSGDETWDDCLLVAKPVVQVAHVSPIDSPSEALEESHIEPGFALVLMLDSAHGPHRGGSGQPFSWEVAQRLAEQVPLMLAGGLTPENLAEAIATVGPWAVDVSSGTETDGRKDHTKVRAFIEAARAADLNEESETA